MNIIEKWDRWSDDHHSPLIDVLRIVLGIFIFYKGLFFMQNSTILLDILQPVDPAFNSYWMVHYVAMSHLAGGLFIALGLLTRLAVVIQIPILLGAILINLTGDFQLAEISQSLVVFVALVFFTFYGSGKFSADRFFGIGVVS